MKFAGRAVVLLVFCCVLVLQFSQPAYCGPKGHWTPGAVGIRGCTVPQAEGLAYKAVFHYQYADTINDDNGTKIKNADKFKSEGMALSHRFVWTPTDEKIPFLDARYSMQLILPFMKGNVTAANGTKYDEYGLGDIYVVPALLSWDVNNWQWVWSAGFMAPTGNYREDNPASMGRGFWSPMMTFGFTWWPDKERQWSLSALSRYETHTNVIGKDLKQGDDFTIEWGLGKMLTEHWEIGLVGFSSLQVTDDSGRDAVTAFGTPLQRDSGHAIGFEVAYNDFKKNYSISFSPKKEFEVVGRPEGWMMTTSIGFFF